MTHGSDVRFPRGNGTFYSSNAVCERKHCALGRPSAEPSPYSSTGRGEQVRCRNCASICTSCLWPLTMLPPTMARTLLDEEAPDHAAVAQKFTNRTRKCRCNALERVWRSSSKLYRSNQPARCCAGRRILAALTTTFRQATGMPVTAWIIKRRITAAQELSATAISTSRQRAKPSASRSLLLHASIRAARRRDAGRFAQQQTAGSVRNEHRSRSQSLAR